MPTAYSNSNGRAWGQPLMLDASGTLAGTTRRRLGWAYRWSAENGAAAPAGLEAAVGTFLAAQGDREVITVPAALLPAGVSRQTLWLQAKGIYLVMKREIK